MSRIARHLLWAALAATLVSGNAGAQLLPSLGLPAVQLPSLPTVPVVGPVLNPAVSGSQVQQVVRPTLDSVTGLPESVAESGPSKLLELRRLRLRTLIHDYPEALEADERGEPVRRGVLITVDPDPRSLQSAVRAGYRIIADETEPSLGMRTVTLAVPRRLSAHSALKRLSKIAPRLRPDYDHIYEPAGGPLAPLAGMVAATGSGSGRIIGMVDGGVASHPSLAGASIEQNGFAGPPKPTGHGTAVASLLVGNQGPFRGAATGAQLLVADVYGGSRAAGSATAIVRALAWLQEHRAQVINISLVGPENQAVARAIAILESRGTRVVAAVGNDGPAAPPQYPASYPGVVSVTAVDRHDRALPEAGRAKHLDFAAPGADMAAALPGQGYDQVRGTSFAAPLVTARLANAGSVAALASLARPGKGRVGRGIVCGDCAVDPRSVGAK